MSAPTAAGDPTARWLAYPGLLQAELAGLAGLAAAGATWPDGSRRRSVTCRWAHCTGAVGRCTRAGRPAG